LGSRTRIFQTRIAAPRSTPGFSAQPGKTLILIGGQSQGGKVPSQQSAVGDRIRLLGRRGRFRHHSGIPWVFFIQHSAFARGREPLLGRGPLSGRSSYAKATCGRQQEGSASTPHIRPGPLLGYYRAPCIPMGRGRERRLPWAFGGPGRGGRSALTRKERPGLPFPSTGLLCFLLRPLSSPLERSGTLSIVCFRRKAGGVLALLWKRGPATHKGMPLDSPLHCSRYP